jgi:hypothetical protein
VRQEGAERLPEISRFFGIVIRIYYRDHVPSHFHARYGEHRAKFDVETGALIDVRMPRRAMALVQEWRALHLDELSMAWRLVQDQRPPNKIEPLE